MTTDLILPKFNMDMESAVLVRWLRADGDRVEEGDPVAEVETDKVNMEVEATVGGILCGLRFREGDAVPVTVTMATIAPDEEAAAAVRTSVAPAGPDQTPARSPEREAGPAASKADPRVTGAGGEAPATAAPDKGDAGHANPPPRRVRATPAIRRQAREHGIDLTQLPDRGGRVIAAALQAAIDQRAKHGAPAPATSPIAAPGATEPARDGASSTRTLLDPTRRAIAERMMRANEVPQITLTVEVRAGALVRARDESVARPSFSAIFAVATARAIRDHLLVNSTFEDGAIFTYAAVDLGIAVARPAGLIVPVLRDADRLTVVEADARIRNLVTRARDGQLRLDEVSGGSFTITSLGEAGVDHFSPLLNPPQVAILGIGRLAPRVVPIENGIQVEPTVHLSLTCDHRVLDGELGAAFLASLRRLLESPAWLVAGIGAG